MLNGEGGGLGLVCQELNFGLFSQAGGKWHTARALCQIRHLCVFICKSPTTKKTEVNFYPWQMAPHCLPCIGDASWRLSGVVRLQSVTAARTQITFNGISSFLFIFWTADGIRLNWRYTNLQRVVAGVKYHHLSTFYAILTSQQRRLHVRAM